MKISEFINEQDLLEKAIRILMEHLGPVETSRFLAIPDKKRLESVKRHRQWQAKLDKETFFDEVFKQ